MTVMVPVESIDLSSSVLLLSRPKLGPGDILTICENTLKRRIFLAGLLIFIVAFFQYLLLGSLYRTTGDAYKLK